MAHTSYLNARQYAREMFKVRLKQQQSKGYDQDDFCFVCETFLEEDENGNLYCPECKE